MPGQIRSLYNFPPLLDSQLPSFTSFAYQQEIFDIHILYPFLLSLWLMFTQDDEVFTRWFLQYVLDDQLEAVGLDT